MRLAALLLALSLPLSASANGFTTLKGHGGPIMGIAVAMLSITGVVIWWKKRKARATSRRRKTAGSLARNSTR